MSDTATVGDQRPVRVVNAAGDTITLASIDSIGALDGVEVLIDSTTNVATSMGKVRVFNPDPQRALWLSALCPGLGQIYNRRYWKLPIVIGAFVGLTYGTTWNNRMLTDYSKAYRDISDNDPNTRSYMDFYPPTVKESDLDKSWKLAAVKHENEELYHQLYMERSANEATRLNEKLCVVASGSTIKTYKAECSASKLGNPIDQMTLDVGSAFVTGKACPDLTEKKTNASTQMTLTPKIGVSPIPPGCFMVRYGSTDKYAASIKSSKKFAMYYKLNYDGGAAGSWFEF